MEGKHFYLVPMCTLTRITLFAVLAWNGLLHSAEAQSVSDTSKTPLQSPPDSTLIIVSDTSSNNDNGRPPIRSHYEAGLSYQSNDVYLGRKDSTVLPYYIPEFSYYHKTGLYATVSLNYLKNSTSSRLDLVTVEGGYMFEAGSYEGQFSVSKYFYSTQSTNVASDIKASLAYQNSFNFGFIKPSFTGTLNIGSKLDFEGLFGLEHCFYFLGGKGDITPTLAAAGSTQNYYNAYYQNKRYNIKKIQKTEPNVVGVSASVLNASTFKILDFEPTVPINYRMGKCTFNFSPTYAIPVHPAIISTETTMANGTVLSRTRAEKIENTFYWTLGFSFLF